MTDPMIGAPGGVARVHDYEDLLPTIPDHVKTVPAPPIVNPFDNPTPSQPSPQADQQPFDSSVQPELLIAGEDEWAWAEDLLKVWYDPAATDKQGLAEQMHALLAVMMNEVRAQYANRGAVPIHDVQTDDQMREAIRQDRDDNTGWGNVMTTMRDHDSATRQHLLTLISLAENNGDAIGQTQNLINNEEYAAIDRNALSVAVMVALVSASDGDGNAKQLMGMTDNIVAQVCGDA